MTDRPIIFTGESVRAILEGRKSQTRQVASYPNWVERVEQATGKAFVGYGEHSTKKCKTHNCAHIPGTSMYTLNCPYGVPGDRLWVRETWALLHNEDHAPVEPKQILYAASDSWEGTRTSPMFMPRWASRITLEITDLRVQRVQEISFKDCIAEGIHPIGREHDTAIPRNEYRELWDSINAKRGFSWESNPWVWAVSFRRLP